MGLVDKEKEYLFFILSSYDAQLSKWKCKKTGVAALLYDEVMSAAVKEYLKGFFEAEDASIDSRANVSLILCSPS